MLGIHKQKVFVSEYDPEWEIAFGIESEILLNLLKNTVLAIEHIGSTSIPGMPAKPIIDIGILYFGKENLDQIKIILSSNQYIYRGNAGNHGGELFVKEISPLVRTHHLHIIEKGDPQWDNYIRFREFLKGSEEWKIKYRNEKMRLWKMNPNDRKAYTSQKQSIISQILSSAKIRPTSRGTRTAK